MMTMIDPPGGWKYGFPKAWNGEGDLTEWLIDNGYPKKEIESMGKYFYVRKWEASENDLNEKDI